MAVIITNMDMPKSCDECPISRYQELHDCPILRMFSTKHSEKRLDDCPLKSADEMIKEIEHIPTDSPVYDGRNVLYYKQKPIDSYKTEIIEIIHKYYDNSQVNNL